MPKTCPACRTINPDTATRCDCGYDFATGRDVFGREHPPPAPLPPLPLRTRFPLASALVGLFRVLAVLVGVLYLVIIALLGVAPPAALLGKVLEGVLAVALLLAVGEGLNLGIGIEANTRRSPFGREGAGRSRAGP